jgi:hypothetical protein
MEQILYLWLIVLGSMTAVIVVVFLIPLFMSIPAMASLPRPPHDRESVDGVITIEDAAEECRSTGLAGLELVEYARMLVAKKMRYSVRNSYDMPGRAFERGQGYCWHMGWALHMILERLGFRPRIVHAFRVKFPAGYVEGVWREGGILGHMWVRVAVDGAEYDVDPGRKENRPGAMHCTPLSKVIPLSLIISTLTYLGSPYINSMKYFKWRKVKIKKEKDDRRS